MARSSGGSSLRPQAATHRAMGTTFEIRIAGWPERQARQAAEEAFALLDRLEEALSCHRATSEISRLAHLEVGTAMRVSLTTLECLEAALRVHRATGGAFDVTAGPLGGCWHRAGGESRMPSAEELAHARTRTGMALLELDAAAVTVAPRIAGVEIDLGGIGKGFAIDRMAELMQEWDVESALLHGGHSSVLGFGSGPAGAGWFVSVPDAGTAGPAPRIMRLEDRAMGASGQGTRGPHIVDPRTGRLADRHRAAWVLAPTATDADALSTAFMVMAPAEIDAYCRRDPSVAALVMAPRADGGDEELRFGAWPE